MHELDMPPDQSVLFNTVSIKIDLHHNKQQPENKMVR